MKVFDCAATRRRLDAFHDRELPVADQIAVSAHLDWCDSCSRAADEMRLVAAALRLGAPGRHPLADEEATSFRAMVLSRVNAERSVSIASQLRAMFEDLRLVYVGGSGQPFVEPGYREEQSWVKISNQGAYPPPSPGS